MQDGVDDQPSGDRAGGSRIGATVLIVAVVVVVAVGVILTVLLTRDDAGSTKGSSGSPAASLPTPHSIVRNGTTYEIAPTWAVAATVDNASSRTITVYAFSHVQDGKPECSFLDPTARIEQETSTSVRIATYNYTGPSAGDATQTVDCSFVSAGAEPPTLYKALTVVLQGPLSDRQLVDARSGKTIGVLASTYAPTPAYLPTGYRQTLVQHFTPEDSFVAIRQYLNRKARSSLEIRVRSETAWARSGKVVARGEVRGAVAVVTDESYERCVSWTPRPGLVAEVCSLLDSFLMPDELIRIANSVPIDQ